MWSETVKEDRFQGWLTSRRQSDDALPDLDFPTSRPTQDTVELLAEGTFGTASNENPIVSELIDVGENNGKFAWTVLAEDTKARINLIRDEERPTDGQYLASNFKQKKANGQVPYYAYYQKDEDWKRLSTGFWDLIPRKRTFQIAFANSKTKKVELRGYDDSLPVMRALLKAQQK